MTEHSTATEPAKGGPTGASKRTSKKAGDFGQRFALIAVWAIVLIVFSLLKPHTYATSGNFQTIFGSQAVLLILALGLILPLTTGDFDLSIAAVMTLTSMLIAILQVKHGWALAPAIVVGLGAGLIVGILNGALVVLLEIDSFIVTLGSSTVVQGIVLWISGSNTVSGVSNGLIDWTITNTFLGISVVFWYGVALTLLFWYVFVYTAMGRRLLFVGRGRNVSRLSGINVGRVRWGALVGSGFISAVAGVFYTGSLGGADPTSGLSFLLPAFAAAFLGATAIYPGRFNPVGTFVAVFFLVSGITGLQLLGADSFVQQLFYGGALILAVALSQLVRRKDIKDEAAASSA
ncbi:ABC transporter permease [Baekduia soli]|uniref:ABC transporter permease n=1 Tax=Baekduia soli TaxID=496014 RepID=A0A5B8U5S6_9ACTN|nr:ABC transporter permease [Baekduia soli]QEC48444.1 ABC transporter permease [Baekduia soli]